MQYSDEVHPVIMYLSMVTILKFQSCSYTMYSQTVIINRNCEISAYTIPFPGMSAFNIKKVNV